MSKYQAYPEYKDSGVEWLGNIPSHWQVTPIKYLATLNPRKSAIDSSLLNKECNFLPMEKLKLNSIVLDEKRLVSDVYDGYTYFEDGDVLMAKVTPCFENKNIAVASGLVNGVGFGSSEIYVLRSNEKTDNRFLYYRLQEDSFMDIATAAMTGAGGLKRVPSEVVNGYSLGTPEVEEQTQIANFLDHETAKIDTLIEKQQQLIKLLKEKRQAVISHAVTKGLNHKAPMKDSGVEWLGEVPEHWVVSRIKNFAKIDSGHTPSRQVEEYWIDCNIPWVSLNDSKTLKGVDYIDDTSNKINELGMANSSAHLLPERSVVFTRDASIGLSAIMSKPMAVSQHLIAWICNDSKLTPEFLLLIFYAMEKEFERYTFGATIKTIGMDDVRSLSGAFPPLEEQKVLVEWAFQKMASLKNGIDKAESVVDLLKERRTALISAAVTGKIDVRKWQRNRLMSEDECSDVV
ncbi:restriction endonuclease subunit S [Vibrio vulnificus]|nr:restriction endonuclease subunit S [Vibrio vulnificus]ELH7494426.1 restriction endonuclease subunit S [Vibrio vulnificus]